MTRERVSKIGVPLLLALAVAVSLWFASPQTVEALNVDFSFPQSQVLLGQTYSFSMTVGIQSPDVLPVQAADLDILNASNAVVLTCRDLPMDNGTRNYSASETGNGPVTVVATTSGGWQYGYENRMAYWEGTGHSLGYGYGYGGPYASITYAIAWTTPAGLAPGSYSVKITVKCNNGNTTFSKTSSSTFTLVQQTGVGGGGGGAPSSPGVTSIAIYTNSEGVFNLAAVAKSEDGNVELAFAKGVQAKTEDGGALRSVSITKMTDPPAPPADSSVVGLVYEIGPTGATFRPAVTLTFHFDASGFPKGIDEKKLVLATWDTTAQKWVELQGTVDATNHTISVSVEHLSVYAIIAHTRSPSLAVSELTISPQQADLGQSISISVKVSNSGDLTGTHTLTLRVNGVSEMTKEVSVIGGDSQSALFTVARDAPGTYRVDVNGLTGEFTIAALVTPTATFSVSQFSISPAEVGIGEIVTISIVVTDTSEYAGIYTATLKIDGAVTATEAVSLSAGESRTITFSTSRTASGVYHVEIGNVSGTFEVSASQPAPARVVNWWVISGIVVVIVAVATFIWLWLKRRAT
jgi:hypothetical protein